MDRKLLREIEASGLYSVADPDTYFSWQGCDNPDCDGYHKGATVYDMKGYRSLEEAQNNNDNYYEYRLCVECLCRISNGE